MANNTQFYALNGGLDYKTFLRHFEKQAEGTNRPQLINGITSSPWAKTKGNGHLVLVDISNGNEHPFAMGDSLPKLEIVDPSEAERRRAVSDMQAELAVIEGDNPSNKQTPKGNGKKRALSRASAKSGKIIESSVNAKVRRVKDIFDE